MKHLDPPQLDMLVLLILLVLLIFFVYFAGNAKDFVLLVVAVAQFIYQLVDSLYGVCFLIQRKVAGKLITPVHYAWHRLRLGAPILRVYLYHPYLVGFCIGKLAYGWVLREQAVPIYAPAGVHGLE